MTSPSPLRQFPQETVLGSTSIKSKDEAKDDVEQSSPEQKGVTAAKASGFRGQNDRVQPVQESYLSFNNLVSFLLLNFLVHFNLIVLNEVGRRCCIMVTN